MEGRRLIDLMAFVQKNNRTGPDPAVDRRGYCRRIAPDSVEPADSPANQQHAASRKRRVNKNIFMTRGCPEKQR